MVTETKQFIKGYRNLSPAEVALINEWKDLAEMCRHKLTELDHVTGIDKRWLAIGTTDLQKAFMCVIRSIAKPESF